MKTRKTLPQHFRKTALAAAIALLPMGAQALPALDAAGEQMRVNTYTVSDQGVPAVAMDAEGNYVVVWNSFFQDDYAYGVYAQRYSAAGERQGNEIHVSTATSSDQRKPAVAMDADGDFVVTWQSYGQNGVYPPDIYAQRYDTAGEPQGGEVRVNTFTGGDQRNADVAMDADGDYVVTWMSANVIVAQRYNAAGEAQGDETRVDATAASYRLSPAIAMDPDGDYVVTWYGLVGDGEYSIYARRFSSAGAPQGDEILVSSFTAQPPRALDVAMDAAGNYVIVWTPNGQDGSGDGIYSRRYNAAGEPQGGEVRVNTITAGRTPLPAVAMDAGGDYVVMWQSSNYGVHAQRYTAAGEPHGGEVQVATSTGGNRANLSAAMSPNGNYVIAWDAYGKDGSGSGIYTQRYADTTPDSFSFPNATGLPVGSVYQSKGIIISGITTAVPISVIDGEYRINGGTWMNTASTVEEGDVVQLRLTTAATSSTTKKATLDIGGVRASLLTKTASATDTSPDPLIFPNANSVPVNSPLKSPIFVPVGYNAAAPISISGSNCTFRVGPGTPGTTATTINPGDETRVFVTAPAMASTKFTCKLTIGTVKSTWVGKTAP